MRTGRGDGGAAFTLLEIMMVMGVIGLLAAIAIPAIIKARDTARTNRARADLRVICHAVEQLAFDTGKWPGGLAAYQVGGAEQWDLNLARCGITGKTRRFTNWKGPYMKAVGKDPWGMDYFFDPDYRIQKTLYAVVGSFGPNRRGRNQYDEDDVYAVLEVR
jgi:general secretion pathway protein G